MSYIRMGQAGEYIDIPEGSQYYLYGNGRTIGGWTYEEFAGVVLDEIEDLIEDDEYREAIIDAFREEFTGIDRDFTGGIAPPERAEIFCQVVDARADDVELRDDLHKKLQAKMGASFSECPYCGDEVRSDTRMADDPICDATECEDRLWADAFEVSYDDYVEIKDLEGQAFEDAIGAIHDKQSDS